MDKRKKEGNHTQNLDFIVFCPFDGNFTYELSHFDWIVKKFVLQEERRKERALLVASHHKLFVDVVLCFCCWSSTTAEAEAAAAANEHSHTHTRAPSRVMITMTTVNSIEWAWTSAHAITGLAPSTDEWRWTKTEVAALLCARVCVCVW